jgi:signal transduction histidine kinase/ActR/RegA family two-component response regulator
MPTPGWKRNLAGTRNSQDSLGMLVRTAVQGAPMQRLLDLGTRSLLMTCAADRAGIWLVESRRGQGRRGEVVEAIPGPIPAQWKQLDISVPFLRSAMESEDPVHVEFGSPQSLAQIGPLVGMHSATWIPIRTHKMALGLAMVAYARRGVEVDPSLLRRLADGIALSVAHGEDVQVQESGREELDSRLRITRAILAGVNTDSILGQIARLMRHYSQAEFVALGKLGEASEIGDGWDGSAEWRERLLQPPLLDVWGQVWEDGQAVVIAGDSCKARAALAGGQCFPNLGRLIALPVVVRGRIAGVLMAGLVKADNLDADLARAESHALLAATALDLEISRHERAAVAQSWRDLIEESQECLVSVDEKGNLWEVSPNARAAFFSDSELPGEARLENLFSPPARDAIAAWLEKFISTTDGQNGAPQAPPVILEAALTTGQVVCMRLRSTLNGADVNSRRWLVHLEDRDRRHAETETIGRMEAEMSGLLDSIDFGVLLLEANGKIRVVSDRLAEILGMDARHCSEMANIEVLVGALRPRLSRPAETVARWREHLRKGEEASWDEFEIVRPARKIVERFVRPLVSKDGRRLGRLEVYRDITGQRLIQSKLLQTEKMAALGQLVSGIAHELNNPLTSIQGYAQLLLSRHSNSHRDADASRISQEAERASHIVKNLLLFSREAKAERRAVNLNEVIERTLALRSYEIKLQGIDVELALDPGLPQTIADGAQLQQVILNLIMNAEQAILSKNQPAAEVPSWRGRISVQTRRLASDRIAMEVSDDGPGISPEIVSRIFDPFFTTKPVGAGTGLGLSIVYGIIQEHGGEIGIESQPGHGASFTMELPALATAAFDFTAEELAVSSGPSLNPASPLGQIVARAESVLVVEDEPTVAQLIADVLSEDGYRVDVLLDSREALQRLENNRYQLVICDLKMPFLDGAGLYRALSRATSPSARRLLFVTGDTMSPRTLEFLKSTGVPYLAKPFLVEELKSAVHRALAAAGVEDEVSVGAKELRVVGE